MVVKVTESANNIIEEAMTTHISVIDEVLDTLRFKGSVFFRSVLASPWGMSLERMTKPRFHIALSGSCFIGVENNNQQLLKINDMDIVILPHGEKHWIADQQHRKLTPSSKVADACELGSPLFQQGKITNKLICGLIDYDQDVIHPIIESLPSVLHFSDLAQNDPIWMTVLLIDSEMEKNQSKQKSLIDRLTEVLFLQLLDRHMKENTDKTGFFAALKNQRIHAALKLIHQYPEKPWELELLARKSNMSRSTLIRQFKETVGISPMAYILNWRMIKVRQLLVSTSKSVEQISELMGFASARTLTKSFLRQFGFTPSKFRKEQQSKQYL